MIRSNVTFVQGLACHLYSLPPPPLSKLSLSTQTSHWMTKAPILPYKESFLEARYSTVLKTERSALTLWPLLIGPFYTIHPKSSQIIFYCKTTSDDWSHDYFTGFWPFDLFLLLNSILTPILESLFLGASFNIFQKAN